MKRFIEKNTSTKLIFGGASISGEGGGYGFGDISEDQSLALLKEAYAKGVNIFDTAPIYGFGLSEKRIGRALKTNRDKVIIISKSGVTWHSNKRVNLTNDPKTTKKMLEQSLRDLDSEYIDLYMIHWPDPLIDIRRPLEVLAQAKHEGKIRHIGLCNTNLDDLKLAKEITTIEVVQSEFNLLNTKAKSQFKYLTQDNISFISWGTLDKGILTKRVTEGRAYDKSDARSWAPWWNKKENKKKLETLKKVWPVINALNISPLELAISYNLQFEPVDGVICGVRSIEQLDTCLKSLNSISSKKVFAEIEEIING